ncbi:MAG: GNAT family N-acetyltransferase [Dehalococcoidia bacterium]|nr:GNAT family N-acetyltransferase [Dehalococcoidia bacterium]
MNDLPPKQLSMIITAQTAARMPVPAPPTGFCLRSYHPGDQDSWVALINTGDYGSDWDRARFDEYIRGPERKEGSRVTERDGVIVAATFASVQHDMDDTGRVDFVTSLPENRGLGLGRLVCSEVVRYLVDRGYSRVILFTDDWRLPAIGLYLSMGFEPQMTREDMPGRWEAIRRNLEAGE